jgi:DNA-binding CsgD family transcriptional regulator
VARGASELVGRDVELAALEAAYDRAVTGESLVVVLAGEAGIGKTRCLSAFVERVTARGAIVMAGGCPPMTAGELPFAPVVEAVAGLVLAHPRDRLIGWLGPDSPALDRLVPELDLRKNTKGDNGPADGYGPLLRELARLLAGVAADAPVLWTVEDLHWSDRATRDILGLIMRATAGLGLCVVLTLRTDELPPDDSLLGWLAELTRTCPMERIEVTQLGRAEVWQLLTALISGPISPELVDRIVAQSGGNPFLVQELAAAHLAGTDELPATVRDAVRARLGSQPDKVQALVRAAAVAAGSGPAVGHDLLVSLLDLPDEEVLELCRAAVATHLLRACGVEGYSFRHALTREAIEADLLPVELMRWHRRVAEQLEAALGGAADPIPLARVAHHWSAAQDLPRALAAAVAAGQAAQAVFALAAAADFYERAIALWPHVARAEAVCGLDEVELLEHAANTMKGSSHSRRAVELATRAIDLVDSGAQPERAARLHRLRGQADWANSGDSTVALHECQVALDLVGNGPARADALAEYSRMLLINDRLSEVEQIASEAADLGRRYGRASAQGHGLIDLAIARLLRGDAEQAVAELLRVQELAHSMRDSHLINRGHVQLANAYEVCGRLADAVQQRVQAARNAIRFGTADSVGVAVSALAAVTMVEMGRLTQADAYTSTPLSTAPNLRMWQLIARAKLDVARGRVTDADAWIIELTDLVAQVGDIQYIEPAAAVAADAALWHGQPERARTATASAINRIREAGDQAAPPIRLCWLALRAEADLAGLARAVDHSAVTQIMDLLALPAQSTHVPHRALAALTQAEHERLAGRPSATAWQPAIDAYTAMGARYISLYPRWRAAEAHLAAGDRAAATDLLRQAHHTATELGATPVRDAVAHLARRARIRIHEQAPKPAQPYGLSPRELDVLRLLAKGVTNRQIASALWISQRTVDVHVSRVLAKVGATRRTEAAVIAQKMGLTE